MLLSICIPVYNGEKYLNECLDPLVKMDDIEIIVVNDGSSDNTLNILNEYQKKYSNVIVLSQENKGQSAARNKALEIAKGKYISFVDADDWLETRAITYLKEIDKEYEPDLIQFGVISEFDNYSSKKELLYPKSKLLNEDESKELYSLICGHIDKRDLGIAYFGLVSCKFYKTAVIKNLKFVSDIVGEDTLFACEAGKLINTSYFLSEYLYHYRVVDGTYSHKVMKDIIPKSVKMLKTMKNVLNVDKSNDELIIKSYYGHVYSKFNWCLQAMGYYLVKENNYRTALMDEIFSHEEYQELLEKFDTLDLSDQEKQFFENQKLKRIEAKQ